MITVVFWLDLRPLLRQPRRDCWLLPSQESVETCSLWRAWEWECPSALWATGLLGLASNRLLLLCFQRHEVPPTPNPPPWPGLKTIMKIYLKKVPTASLADSGSWVQSINAMLYTGILPSRLVSFLQSSPEPCGALFSCFPNEKLFQRSSAPHVSSFPGVSLLTNCNLCDLFCIFLSQCEPLLISPS